MPSVKQGGGYTLTFSKKNSDVKEILANKMNVKGFIATDYICDAIRFYERNKDKEFNSYNKINAQDIEKLIEEKIKKVLANVHNPEGSVLKQNSLEDVDDIDDDDIEED